MKMLEKNSKSYLFSNYSKANLAKKRFG